MNCVPFTLVNKVMITWVVYCIVFRWIVLHGIRIDIPETDASSVAQTSHTTNTYNANSETVNYDTIKCDEIIKKSLKETT